MALFGLQQKVYQNKISKKFNVQDVSKEIILLTEEIGELNTAFLQNDKENIVDAVADICIYCLGLSEMFKFNSNLILNFKVEKPNKLNLQSLLPFLTIEVGNLAKLYKESNQKNVSEINKCELFKQKIGNLLGYCYLLFNVLDKDMVIELEKIIQKNSLRQHSGSFINFL